MRRKDKLLHITKLNKKLNESKIKEDFSDDMATHQERFTNPYDDDMAYDSDDYHNGNDVISTDSVIKNLIKNPEMWSYEKELGFKNSSSQRAFYFETQNIREIYFEVELNGDILSGHIESDDEMFTLKNRDKNVTVANVKVKYHPELVAKAIITAIKKYAEAFVDLEDSKEFRMKEHHSGEYSSTIMNMKISDFLDALQSKDKAGYEVVEKIIENNFTKAIEEGDKEDYYYPFDEPERDKDSVDPYELKEKMVGLPSDLEFIDEGLPTDDVRLLTANEITQIQRMAQHYKIKNPDFDFSKDTALRYLYSPESANGGEYDYTLVINKDNLFDVKIPREARISIIQGNMNYVESDCGCSLKESEPTDVQNSKWFSDEDGERIMDIQVD